MVDIDHFKVINDTHGHGVGDEVIQTVARRLSDALRGHDVICRYGGEEFASAPIPTSAGPLPVTVSVGLAVPDRQEDLPTLLNHADDALYQAKRTGRNQVVTAANPSA